MVDIADSLNKLRLIPRVLVALYGYTCYDCYNWFILLPDPTNAQQNFAIAIFGGAAAWFGFYVNSGAAK